MIRAALFLVALLLAGCSGLVDLGPSGPPATIYTLPAPARAAGEQSAAFRLYVEEPDVAGALDSARIAVRSSPVRYEYLARARWDARLPRLVQRRVAAALDAEPAIEAIGAFNTDLPVDYRLKLDLRAFEAETDEGGRAGHVRVAFAAILTRATSSEIVSNRYFDRREPVGGRDADAIVAAFDRAMDSLTGELAAWVTALPDSART